MEPKTWVRKWQKRTPKNVYFRSYESYHLPLYRGSYLHKLAPGLSHLRSISSKHTVLYSTPLNEGNALKTVRKYTDHNPWSYFLSIAKNTAKSSK